MYPWLWIWSPRIQFPYSGALSQSVEPSTSWFFGAIKPQAGVGDLEQKIFDVASYGTQLGLINDVLLSLASPGAVPPAKAQQSLEQLTNTYRKIENLKSAHREDLAESAEALLEKLRDTSPADFDRVIKRFALVSA